jgi:hypothetical protein
MLFSEFQESLSLFLLHLKLDYLLGQLFLYQYVLQYVQALLVLPHQSEQLLK